MPPEALEFLTVLDADPVWTISELESRFYQQNMLLRDSDVNGMAHSLEIRVPILDQRMVNLVNAIPGPVRLPSGAADSTCCAWPSPPICAASCSRSASAASRFPLPAG